MSGPISDQLQAYGQWRTSIEPVSLLQSGEVRPRPPAFGGDWAGADLTGKALLKADFSRVTSLVSAKFDGADLRGACLEFDDAGAASDEARLRGTDLTGATFQGARLNGASFRNANLRDSALVDSQGLSCEALAGADLRGATLPSGISDFKGLDAVADASATLQGSLQLMFALRGFAALTMLSMKDENLILHNGQNTTQLPILQAVVSPLMFSYMAPLVILVLFAYQVFYSLSLWRLLSFLPAFFPDGTPLDRRAHPVLINTFVRVGLKRLVEERHDKFQYVARGLIAFAPAPLTLTAFWVCCLKMHDPLLSGALSSFVACSSFLFLFVMTLAGGILRGEVKTEPITLRSLFGDHKADRVLLLLAAFLATAPFLRLEFLDLPIGALLIYRIFQIYLANIKEFHYAHAAVNLAVVALVNFLVCLILSFNSFAARNGSLKEINIDDPNILAEGKAPAKFPKDKWSSLFPTVLKRFNYYPFLDIRGRVVSRRPDSWTGQPEKEGDEMLAVSGADLEGADLRSMDAERAFLAKANLRRVNLGDAYLRFANLREADLTGARFEGTYLRGASLRDANLAGADLRGAIFSADFDDPTHHIGPNFQGAKIDKATQFDLAKVKSERVNNFVLAYFGASRLEDWTDPARPFLKQLLDLKIVTTPRTDGDLGRGDLHGHVFDGQAMSGADLRGFDLRDAKFRGNRPGRDRVMVLSGALFTGADLARADFTDADLTGADFSQATLTGANFSGAKLSGAKFTGSNWKQTKNLDAELMEFLGHLEGKK